MASSPIVSNDTYDPPELDHIVHLVQTGKLGACVQAYEKLGFSKTEGGVHADGLTQNALIVLTDGVYIELIEFLDKPEKHKGEKGSASQQQETLAQWKDRRSKHWWWGKKQGWIDWCLKGGVQDKRVSYINAASQLASERHRQDEKSNGHRLDLVKYKEATTGGRRSRDEKDIQWNVTFPEGKEKSVRGKFPFWCEDITPRGWRVPTPAPQHPNLTQGLAALTLLYYPESFPSRLASLQLILLSSAGSAEEILANLISMEPPPVTEGQSALPTEPVEIYLSTPDGPPLPLRVKAAEDPDELQWLRENGEGLWEVEISVASDRLPPTAPPDGIERTTHALQYGRLRLHPIHGVSYALSQGKLQ